MNFKRVYVTVGTTKFDSLITAVISDEVLNALKTRGCQELVLQIGQGKPIDSDAIARKYDIKVDQHKFKFETPRTDIIEADLIIGHAGAGTCMDIIYAHKPAVVVINEELMDNHQTELAWQLAEDGYVFCCNVSQLAERLKASNFGKLRPYEREKNMDKFVECLNEMMTC